MINVALRNERTGEVKDIKIGWSWTLFLFSGLLGIPLFLRRLNTWGGAMIAFWVVYQVVPALMTNPDDRAALNIGLGLLGIGLSVFFGLKGNELTAKHWLENGWTWANPDDQSTILARRVWSLS